MLLRKRDMVFRSAKQLLTRRQHTWIWVSWAWNATWGLEDSSSELVGIPISYSDSLGLPIPLGSHRRDCSCELRYKFGFIYSVKSHNFVFLPNLNHRKSGMHLHNTNNGFFKIFMMSFYGCYLFKFWTSDSSECVWAFKYFVIILSCFYSMTIIKENGLTTRARLSLPDVSS